MIIIPGFVISLLTFPGVVVHEAAHLFFCKKFRVPVFDVCFFRFSNPAGYVVHGRTDDFRTVFFISMGPFFANTLLCVLFSSAAFLPVWELQVKHIVPYFFYWLGLSIGMHAFPSTDDLKHIWALAPARAKSGSVLAIFSLPVVALLYVLNALRFFWADLGYGVAVGILGPLALFKAFA